MEDSLAYSWPSSSAVPLDDEWPEINSLGFWATVSKKDDSSAIDAWDLGIEWEVLLYKQKAFDDDRLAWYLFPKAEVLSRILNYIVIGLKIWWIFG